MIFFKKFKKQPNLVHAIMERKDGSVNPYSNPASEKNVLAAVEKLGFSDFKIDNLIYAEQLHGANVYNLPAEVGGIIKLNVDGLISSNRRQILIIKTADCVPILIFDPKKQVVVALHGGRKSLIAGIIPKALLMMNEKFNSSEKDILVGIGPHIRDCCYWLKEDTLKELKNTKWFKYFIKRSGKVYFNLTQIVLDQLKESGILENNIEDCGICTFCQAEKFFSARKKEEEPEIYQKEGERFPCFGTFIGLVK